MNNQSSDAGKWYIGVTRYQWLVLIVASLGWVFDAFEGQLYTISRSDMLSEILELPTDHGDVKAWGDKILAIFLIGGTIGGWLFSSLADRWGRNPVMALTILFYSVFSGLTVFATELWHVGVLRFLVAMGVGGEWAVGAALVAEVFPKHARERASGIFHATSVGGLWLATATGLFVGSNWRWAYLIGVLPALLVLWVRLSIKEPEAWKEAKKSKAERMGSFRELLGTPRWRTNAVFGALLAMVGLATFWSVVIAGQDLAADLLKKIRLSQVETSSTDAISKTEYDLALKETMKAESANAKFAFGFVQTTGAGIGMLAFGPMSTYFGRKRTFAIMHVAALIMTPIVCWLPLHFQSYGLLLCLLPLFGFFAQGIHAGYAVYFPELFPTHLRSTGAGFCFNTGRILASPVLFWLSPWIKKTNPESLQIAITYLSCFFLLGLIFLVFLPETKGEPLPE
jgi:MFS family permease